jgi:hypothetical protein
MDNSTITHTLQTIHQLLSPVKHEWIIIGTASLYLQGYTVEPNDIDILCSTEAAVAIENALSPYKIEFTSPVSRNKFRSVYSRYIIEETLVELMGDLQINTQDGWITLPERIQKTEEVILEGAIFKVPSKADQHMIYTLFGREKDDQILHMLR